MSVKNDIQVIYFQITVRGNTLTAFVEQLACLFEFFSPNLHAYRWDRTEQDGTGQDRTETNIPISRYKYFYSIYIK